MKLEKLGKENDLTIYIHGVYAVLPDGTEIWLGYEAIAQIAEAARKHDTENFLDMAIYEDGRKDGLEEACEEMCSRCKDGMLEVNYWQDKEIYIHQDGVSGEEYTCEAFPIHALMAKG